MVKASDCLKKYGQPGDPKTEGRFMAMWFVPSHICAHLPVLPQRIYCNRDLVEPLEKAFRNLILRGLASELKTWDGCYQVRRKRGGVSASLHSWGVAVDVNAAWNGMGKTPTLSSDFVQAFKDAGFDWGGDWFIKDGMHFQLSTI